MRRLTKTAWILAAACLFATTARADHWPAWRGPTALGVSHEKNLPTHWSTTDNVKWKVALPDEGNATPIVWGRRVFLTQATDGGKTRATLCYDRRDGNVLWRKAMQFSETERTHKDNPYCSASPVTDGERVIVSHGSAGVFCYDMAGKELWRRDLGLFQHVWGNASSPVIAGDLCYLNCGPGPRTFLIALDKRTGKTVWQVDIPGGMEDGNAKTWTGSWSTPLLVEADGRTDLVMTFPHRLTGRDPATGEERWRSEGLSRLVYTSPLAGEGVLVAMSGFMGPSMAIRMGGRGDVTKTHRLWHTEKESQRIGSGIILDGHIYIINEPGVAVCVALRTGKMVWQERIGRTAWGSFVLADGNLYLIDVAGDTHVIRAATTFQRVAKNALGERTRASIAISNGELFIRTYKHLWCIARGGGTSDPP